MLGLIEKDLRLLLQRKSYIVMVAGMALVFAFSTTNSMVVGYVTLFFTIFTLTTISYDEMDNGYMFLMTLPISRKSYAIEKYVFGLVTGIFAWVVALALRIVSLKVHGEVIEDGFIAEVAPYLVVCFIIISIMIPIELKFGAEKSRVALIIMAGLIAIPVIIIGELADAGKIDTMSLISLLDKMTPGMINTLLAALTIAIAAVSIIISIRIMEKKEF